MDYRPISKSSKLAPRPATIIWVRVGLTLVAMLPASARGQAWQAAPSFPNPASPRTFAAGLNVDGTLLAIGGTPLGTAGDKDTPIHYLPPGGAQWLVGPWAEGRIVRPGAGRDALGRIIVFGGVDGLDPEGDLGAAYVYDLVDGQAQSIAARGPDAPPDHFAWATDDAGRIYALGGGPGADADTVTPNSTYAERYLAASDTWEPIAPLPVAVADAAAVFDGRGHILVLGGYNADASARVATVQQYDIAGNAWSTTTVPALPAALSGLSAVLGADGRVYALGGETGPAGAGVAESAAYALHPLTEAWSAAPDMTTPRRHFAVVRGDDDFIYALGGDNDAGGTSLVEKLYTPPCPTFVEPPADTAHWAGPPVALTAFVAGGEPLSYRWQRNGVDLFDGPALGGGMIGGADTTTLTITTIAPADEGAYTLTATNPCGTAVSSPAVLTVWPAPAIPSMGETRSLHPAWAKSSRATGVTDSLQTGVCTRDVPDYNDISRPTVWHGTPASVVDLTPAGSVGGGVASAGGDLQVGWWWWPYQCRISGQWYTCYQAHAAAWSGTAATHDNLHVSGWEYTNAADTDGIYRVGSVSSDDEVGNYTTHAVMWSPPNNSPRDLHPAGVSKSGATAVADGKQYGWIHTPFPGPVTHAAMWSGSAGSFVDMQPGGASRSQIRGAGDAQQVGSAEFGGAWHAGLWADSPGSFLDLHPTGTGTSQALDCAGGLQVGYVNTSGSRHAAIWAGTPDSWTDLHPFLPAGFTGSSAAAIAVTSQGVVTIVGEGYNAATGRTEAVMWRSAAPPGDCDGDGNIDLDDFPVFADCLAGPATSLDPGCTCGDLDANGTVDLVDFQHWQMRASR